MAFVLATAGIICFRTPCVSRYDRPVMLYELARSCAFSYTHETCCGSSPSNSASNGFSFSHWISFTYSIQCSGNLTLILVRLIYKLNKIFKLLTSVYLRLCTTDRLFAVDKDLNCIQCMPLCRARWRVRCLWNLRCHHRWSEWVTIDQSYHRLRIRAMRWSCR